MNTSTNKTTQFRYNADGKLVELIVQNEATGTQTTKWIYGTTKAESGVASNELVRAKIYPDSDDQGNPLADGPDTTFDRVEYRYNTLGEVVEMKDQNQTVHQYVYDTAGRLIADKVVSFVASVIDGSVQAIGRAYDARGQLASVTSYANAAMTTVVNQVTYSYNGFGQVLADIQSHAGVTTGSTPRVGYEYENGTGNSVRQKKLVYPNGRQIHSHYGTTGTIDDLLDRVRELRDGTVPETVLARYTKRGTNATVIVEYPEPAVELTYLKQGSESFGDAGDQYTGLDRFNRIEDIRWLKRAGATIADVERVQYGFDRASNRTWRKNLVAPPGFDEAYQYDGLYQLSDMRRGELNINHTTIGAIPVWEESWNYDSAGNWKDYTSRVGGADPTVQNRTHNKVNEITFIDGSNTKVGYDGAGNMTVMPKVGALGTAQQNTWDAWNRLVKVMEGAAVVGQYAYDGLTRRIAKTVSGEVRHGYFTTQWQLLEERTDASETAERQFVWGLRYIDDLVLRDCAAFTPTRLYTLHDQWHVAGVVDVAGIAQERYIYSAFGVSTVLTGAFAGRTISLLGWETRYGAYRFDGETDLSYARYRYLNSTAGRWLSQDPISGQLLSRNAFDYTGNRPVNSADPSGLVEYHESPDGNYWDYRKPYPKPPPPPVPEPEPPTPPTDKPTGWAAVLGCVHGVLDIVGLIPVAGEIADGLNAVIYVCEGDLGNAALSAAGMIPIVGDTAKVSGRVARKVTQAEAEAALKSARRNMPNAPSCPKDKCCPTKQPAKEPASGGGGGGGGGRWHCTASCDLQAIGTTRCPEHQTGAGSGHSEDAACKAAKKDANSRVPRGCYKRHCRCPVCIKR